MHVTLLVHSTCWHIVRSAPRGREGRILYHMCGEQRSGVRNPGSSLSPSSSSPQFPHPCDKESGFGHLYTLPDYNSLGICAARVILKTNLQHSVVSKSSDSEVRKLSTYLP